MANNVGPVIITRLDESFLVFIARPNDTRLGQPLIGVGVVDRVPNSVSQRKSLFHQTVLIWQ